MNESTRGRARAPFAQAYAGWDFFVLKRTCLGNASKFGRARPGPRLGFATWSILLGARQVSCFAGRTYSRQHNDDNRLDLNHMVSFDFFFFFCFHIHTFDKRGYTFGMVAKTRKKA